MTWLDERTLEIARMLREPTAGRRGYTRRLHQVDPWHDGRASKEDEPRLHRQPKTMVRFPGCRNPIRDLRGDCGRIGVHAGKDMVSGHTQSCGCQRIKKGGA